MEINKKFSIPFACLLMGIIGAPPWSGLKTFWQVSGFAIAIGITLYII